jgi:hypothetical protein
MLFDKRPRMVRGGPVVDATVAGDLTALTVQHGPPQIWIWSRAIRRNREGHSEDYPWTTSTTKPRHQDIAGQRGSYTGCMGGLCCTWNACGAAQIASGKPALVPTATFAGAGVALVLAILIVVIFNKWLRVYKTIAIFAALLAVVTIWNAFMLDPSLWISEVWRWAGVLMNAIGAIAATTAVVASSHETKGS